MTRYKRHNWTWPHQTFRTVFSSTKKLTTSSMYLFGITYVPVLWHKSEKCIVWQHCRVSEEKLEHPKAAIMSSFIYLLSFFILVNVRSRTEQSRVSESFVLATGAQNTTVWRQHRYIIVFAHFATETSHTWVNAGKYIPLSFPRLIFPRYALIHAILGT